MASQLEHSLIISNQGSFFVGLSVCALVLVNGVIIYSALKYRLLEVVISPRSAFVFALVYFFLFLGMSPFLLLIHKTVAKDPQNSLVYLIAGFLVCGTILFLGPLLYAYSLRRKSYFDEYTIAGLAHEFKNPLNVIENALASLLEQDYAQNAKQARYLDMIERNTFRLRRYVENLLHVFKFRSGKVLQLELVDIKKLCADVVDPFRPFALARGISVEVKTPDASIDILCDPEKIEQAFSNLISNAFKFTTMGTIKISVEDLRDRVVIAVEDSGPGIPKDELPYIFDRFFQGKNGRKVAKGTGIGLAIAKTWVMAHHGEICAESNGTGKGSRLWFSLPK